MKSLTIFCWMKTWLFLVLYILSFVKAEVGDIQYMSTGEDPAVFVRNKIKRNAVMVFARSYGPHNDQAKDLLKKLSKEINIKMDYVDVDLMDGFDGSLVMLELQELTGQWAFPNIFIGGNHVGGNDELDQKHALGELEAMLREAGQEL